MELLREWLEVAGGFMPHGHCIQWVPWIFWTYLIADTVTFFSYASDYFALRKLQRSRPDLQEGWILHAFGLFIASCGLVHGLLVVSLFWGIYPAIAVSKALMAFISFPVAIIVWPIVNKVILLPELSAYYFAVDKVNKLEAEKVMERRERKKLENEIAEKSAYIAEMELRVKRNE